MVQEQIILSSERLRDGLQDFQKALRAYRKKATQVTGHDDRKNALRLAETWLVEIAPDQNVAAVIGASTVADLNVHFQRILTFSEHSTTRSKYEAELRAILDDYTARVVLPLKQARGSRVPSVQPAPTVKVISSAFIGQSFDPADSKVNKCVADVLEAIGIRPITGERPRADAISDKVKRLIDDQPMFVGIFTKRDKIAGKREWTTSAWVIDEKAYALGQQKPLILLKEEGVGSIGGIQGDYEYISFKRDELETLALRLVQFFDLTNNGLRK